MSRLQPKPKQLVNVLDDENDVDTPPTEPRVIFPAVEESVGSNASVITESHLSTEVAARSTSDDVHAWKRHYGSSLPNEKYPCKYCHAVLSIKSGTISANRHLREQLPVVLLNSNADSHQTRLSLIDGLVQRRTQYSPELFRALLIKFIVRTNQSFVVVETPELVELLTLLRPDVHVPSADTVRRAIIATYIEAVEKVKEKLLHIEGKVNCTCDLWTSPANKSYMAVTIHYLDVHFQMCNMLLSFVEIDEDSHSADVLISHFWKEITRFFLQEKVLFSFWF